ncbi:MAG: hypothetical protein SFV19_16815 [Rhodospirillaceae bacterium]|nr:hypothetical protein [Rhodospirillaceae bacterium]
MTHKVADVRANPGENIDTAVRTIGKSKDRLAVFKAIYAGKQKVKNVAELAATTGLSEIRVLQESQKLVARGIVIRESKRVDTPKGKRTAYRKDEFFANEKNKIIALVKNPAKLAKIPTKQRPHVGGGGAVVVKIAVQKNQAPRLLTVDDIDSFAAVRRVGDPPATNFDRLPEQTIKEGFQKVLRQEGTFKDWGGETNDLFTGKMKYKGRRIHAAFAFKGKATSGPLVPKKMGKHGDQVNRLFGGPAQIFMVVYPREVKESIYEQMRVCALARAMSGDKIYYCVIGGSDFARLYYAYPKAFAAPKKGK